MIWNTIKIWDLFIIIFRFKTSIEEDKIVLEDNTISYKKDLQWFTNSIRNLS